MPSPTNSCGTGANDATVGSLAWTSPGNITSSDNVYASCGGSALSNYLKATNFGFALPSTAIVSGIVVEWKRLQGTTCTDSAVRIVKGGTIGSTNRSTGATWSGSESYVAFGSSSDLWGETWTHSDINSATFGAVLAANVGAGGTSARVDHCRITVHYVTAGQALSATMTVGGAVAKRPGRALAATISLAGASARALTRALAATLTPAGALLKRPGKPLPATLTLTPTVRRALAYLLAASLSPAGVIRRALTRTPTAATVTVTGATRKSPRRAFAVAAITVTGAAVGRGFRKGFTATLTVTGGLRRVFGRRLTATIAGSGAVVRTVTRAAFTATLTHTGNLRRRTLRLLAVGGSITLTGAVGRGLRKRFTATLTATPSLATSVARRLWRLAFRSQGQPPTFPEE